MQPTKALVVALVALTACNLAACNDRVLGGESGASQDGTGQDGTGLESGESASSSGEGSDDASDTDTDVDTATDSDTTDSDTDTTDSGGPVCGNGILEDGEVCDDGNLVSFDGCNDDCRETAGVEWEHPPFGTPGPCDDYLGVAHSSEDRFAVVGALGRAEGALANCQIMIKVFEVDGTLAWEKVVDPGPNCDEAWGVDFDGQGNVWVGGHTYDPQTLHDHWIAKYSGAGDELWTQTFDGGLEDYGYDLSIDAQGRAIFVGASQVPGTGYDLAVRAIAPDGELLWTKLFDEDGGSDFGLDVLCAGPDIFVGGFVSVAGQDENAWAAKLDDQGEIQWVHSHDGPVSDQDRVGGVALAPNGDLVIAGFETSQTNQDIWIRRLDPGGAELWTRTFSDPLGSADRAQEVAIDELGHIIVAGQHYTAGELDSFDTWLRKYDEAGEVLWTLSGADGPRLDLWYAVDAFAGSIVVAGGLSLAPGDCTDAVVRRYSP